MVMPEKKAARKKYCSNECKYQFRERPSGLTYNIVAENTGWFQQGHASLSGADHPAWKGDGAGYREIHRWVAANKERTGVCSSCEQRTDDTQFANLSHEYRRDLSDWAELCRSCHWHYDQQAWGRAKEIFGSPYGQRVEQ